MQFRMLEKLYCLKLKNKIMMLIIIFSIGYERESKISKIFLLKGGKRKKI
jgi:hypothetical protein